VILLDASALAAFLGGEKAAGRVESMLRSGDVAIPSVNLAESLDVLERVLGLDGDAVDARLVPLLATTLRVVPIGEAEARRAASVRASHYDRRRAPLSLADSVLIATASLLRASIATSDEPLAVAARREGIDVTSLPSDDKRRT